MNKKTEKQIRKQLHNLLDTVLDINGISERQQEITGTLPTVFFEFCGHIGQINISVCDKGWVSGGRADLSKYIDLDPEQIKKEIDSLKERYGENI